MKKAIVSLLLISILLLSACTTSNSNAGSKSDTGATSNATDSKVSTEPNWIGDTLKYDLNAQVNGGDPIDILMWVEPETEPYYKEIIDKYMEVHPNVKVKSVSQPWDDYWTKLPLALSAGNGPDIYRSHFAAMQNVSGYSKNLPEDVFPRKELFADFPDAEDLILEDGNLYSIPLGSTFSGGIYYNKTMWTEAGLAESDIPKTWDEFISVGKKLTKTDSSGNITQYGFSLDHAFENFIVSMNYVSGQALMKEDQFTWNLDAPATYENIELLKSFKDEHKFMMYSDGDCEDQFGHGQAAMISNWNWVGGYFNDVYPEVDWGYFLTPSKDGKPAPAYDLKDYEWSLGVSAEDESKQAVSFDLLKYFLCEKSTFADVSIRLGLMPTNVNLRNDERIKAYENLIVADSVADRHVYLGALPSSDVRNKALRIAGSDIFINGKDPKDVIPATETKIMSDITQNAMEYKAIEDKYEHYSELHQ